MDLGPILLQYNLISKALFPNKVTFRGPGVRTSVYESWGLTIQPMTPGECPPSPMAHFSDLHPPSDLPWVPAGRPAKDPSSDRLQCPRRLCEVAIGLGHPQFFLCGPGVTCPTLGEISSGHDNNWRAERRKLIRERS